MMAVKHDRRLSSAVGVALQPTLSQSYVSPRPASRVGTSTDAAKYLRRNRGSSSLWLVKRCGSTDVDDDDDDGRSLTTARVPRRLSGNEASEIFRRSQGSVGVLLDERNQVGYSSPRPQPRLTSSEAEVNARRKADLFKQADVGRPPPGSRPERRTLSTEAKANAAKGAGTMNAVLRTADDQPLTSPLSALRAKSSTSLSLCLDDSCAAARQTDDATSRPRQRVKPEAQEIARRSSGKTCAAAVAGRLSADATCDVRVRGAGRDNYEASTCGSVGGLLSTYGQQSANSQLPGRIPEGPGKEIAKHGKTGTLCYQMNNYGHLPPSPRPESRLRCEGKRFVCRNTGNNMAKCLSPATKPQRRKHSAADRRKKT